MDQAALYHELVAIRRLLEQIIERLPEAPRCAHGYAGRDCPRCYPEDKQT